MFYERDERDGKTMSVEARSILVLGMGASAFGREQRAVTALKHMLHVSPYFLISRWEDGSVSRLLERHQFEYRHTGFGYLGRSRLRWTLISLINLPRVYFDVVRMYLGKHCKGVLLLCLHPFLAAFVPLLLLKYLARAKIILYSGDIPRNDGLHRVLGRMLNRIADNVIVNSHAVRMGYAAIGIEESKTWVIYNGKDLARFDKAVPIDFRRRFDWPADALLVGFAGQFRPNKGVWDFIKAAEIVLSQHDHVRFLLIGRHDPQEPFQNEIAQYLEAAKLSDRIVFTGWIEEIERAFRVLDAVVVPSRHEDPAPNVSIEAAACGVPVIATAVGGNVEIVSDGETGFLVGREQPEVIAQYLLALLCDPKLQQATGAAARERAGKFFDIIRNARQLEGLLLHG
jgi:glycosyltransferase involved in cell wall biosynthesis